ncbi:hypothetical protein B0H67DRAFT_640726 [Lasiosphaeris hirsuta]|uniref:Uncharacterized protein n=1 Tax=Lasiosphaeris hirsuta TaxID=260670 RepID=A0AA40AY55_9PEZI|nr:hypothetical protein B0H67DRAFT_640726 [Lasiosphaeris hirsuta]
MKIAIHCQYGTRPFTCFMISNVGVNREPETNDEFDDDDNAIPAPIETLPYMPSTIREIQSEWSALTMEDLERYNGMFKPRFFQSLVERSEFASLRSNLRVMKLDLAGARDQNTPRSIDWENDGLEIIQSVAALTALEEPELDTSCLFTNSDAGQVMGVRTWSISSLLLSALLT